MNIRALIAFISLLLAFSNKAAEPAYEFKKDHDPNGIGKFYHGREIAHVMGHQAADWLERPERDREERPEILIDALKLRPGMHVADLGAGTGYFTRRIAKGILPGGKVYAVELQQEMLDLLAGNLKKEGITNAVSVLGTEKKSGLPTNVLDLILMVDVYHEFSYPDEMLKDIKASLKSRGKVAFVEYRLEDPAVPIKVVHKMSEAQVRKEVESHGLKFVENFKGLPRQHLLIFEKP